MQVMIEQQCSICHMYGHERSYCAFNGQLYHMCSKDPVASGAYRTFRSFIKAKAEIVNRQEKLQQQKDMVELLANSKAKATAAMYGVQRQ